MTSEVDNVKTNELLHRRKLRLQQVREQSKEIAKKIRQRAKVETLRQVKDVDAKKEKHYLECQKQFVNKLQELYINGLQNVGKGHENASEYLQEDVEKKIDKSKLRGKEAVAEVRRKKQEILNKKKELLDRKLQAREAANEISREKSNTIGKTQQITTKNSATYVKELVDNQMQQGTIETVTKVDMATQLNLDEPLNGYQTDIPTLLLPENETTRDPDDVPEKLDKSKRPNLFALSDEMPSSLRGGSSNTPQFNYEQQPMKSSVTLVSEYIQNRKLRLRETETKCTKKPSDEIQNIKQTIQQTRASKMEGNAFNNICQVCDVQLISVPTWKAEKISQKSQCCNKKIIKPVFPPINSRRFKSFINSTINRINYNAELLQKDLPVHEKEGIMLTVPGIKNNWAIDTARKSTVTVYDHTTRDVRTLPCNDDNLVIEEQNVDDDAFSKAQKEETNGNLKQKELQNKIAERRNKVAMTKENVDKEYRDTLAFLNSLPKDMSNKPIKTAYMDEERQQQIKENRERKLQHEFKSLNKESGRHLCKHKISHQHVSKSPIKRNDDSDNDFQYSWMPVPGRPENQVNRNVSTTNKPGNTVKFSNNNDYYEYRSNYNHTPPTKDLPSKSKVSKNRFLEAVVIEEKGTESTDCSSITSDSSTSDNLVLNTRRKKSESSEEFERKLSDADRIVIYKILNSKLDKKKKSNKNSKLADKSVRSGAAQQVGHCHATGDTKIDHNTEYDSNTDLKHNNIMNKASFDQLTEGIYKAVNENGQVYKELSFYTTNSEEWYISEEKRPWWDNMTSLKFCDNPVTSEKNVSKVDNIDGPRCSCAKVNTQDDCTRSTTERLPRKCGPDEETVHYPSAVSSSSSLKKADDKLKTIPSDNGYITLKDDADQANGKLYFGSTNLLRDEAYEVVIQLRKKEHTKIVNGKNVDTSKEQGDVVKTATAIDTNKPLQSSALSQQENVENKVIIEDDEIHLAAPSPINSSTRPANSIENRVSVEADSQPSKVIYSQAEETKMSNKIDSKKAISTYTQTTNSPIHKPVFMHMSSSTSTAYMSPPEVIMPRFLNEGYVLSCDETCDSIKDSQNSQSYEDYKYCRCKHHACRKKRSNHPPNLFNCTKINHRVKKIFSPVRSAGELSDTRKNYKTTPDRVKYKHCKCSMHKNCHKEKKETVRNTAMCNRHKQSPLLRDASFAPNKHTINIPKRSTKRPLNPIIKEYVNKLLELNKEGMKAVEIINEECSSVPTPSSSIINDKLNINNNYFADKKISLEQIKNILKEKITNEFHNKDKIRDDPIPTKRANSEINKSLKLHSKLSRRKQQHKVKTFKVSKKKLNIHKKYSPDIQTSKPNSTSSSFKNDTSDQAVPLVSKKCNQKHFTPPPTNGIPVKSYTTANNFRVKADCSMPRRSNSARIPTPTNLEHVRQHNNQHNFDHPPRILTPTFDSENNFVEMAEGKLQNMEKIADLTEKCTKRLSNLAKVLEEVRRNKSLVYSQITSSESTSDSDIEQIRKMSIEKALSPVIFNEIQGLLEKISPAIEANGKNNVGDKRFIPLLSDIPKPVHFETSLSTSISQPTVSTTLESVNTENPHTKSRGKPPPALSRIHLKNDPEPIIPHELSTVLEVDSPMSLKLKTQSHNDINVDSNISNKSIDNMAAKRDNNGAINVTPSTPRKECPTEFLKPMGNSSKKLTKTLNVANSDMSKGQMMDLKQFNEIMLKPFISIQEYAKKQNIEKVDEIFNTDDNLKEKLPNDDLSSLHSESSLPDVIAELLRRKIISEPFKFDTGSNVNSSTISTESTVSLLALTSLRNDKKKANSLYQAKKKIPETSDTLSLSSNPDLENAFQKLGMGWASSTLKKTKERLALSSSSTTSASSSGAQLRNKVVNGAPVAAGSVSILPQHVVKSPKKNLNDGDGFKTVGQQMSVSNSMTVKEFLTNQLAKKITFTNQSSKDFTRQEFVSLCETRMPEEMKQTVHDGDQSLNSVANCSNNRARTSTPVQIFRSMTYQSSSSSNTSNGLFSNADDLSSVKVTSNSIRNHSTSDKDDLTIPNYILKVNKGQSECSKSD